MRAARALGIEALRGQRERHEGIDPEPRRQCEGVVGDHAHRDRHDSGDERRACGHCRGIEPERLGDDAAVHEQDVGHDHERGHAGADLRWEVGASFREPEVGRQPVLVVRRGTRFSL